MLNGLVVGRPLWLLIFIGGLWGGPMRRITAGELFGRAPRIILVVETILPWYFALSAFPVNPEAVGEDGVAPGFGLVA